MLDVFESFLSSFSRFLPSDFASFLWAAPCVLVACIAVFGLFFGKKTW